MAQRETPPPKKDVARALLLRGSVFVYLDPRRDDVAVPVWLAKQPQLVLQVGLDLPVPIPDLRVDDAGVFGTLSFNRAPFTCAVPWDAVFALWGDDGMGMVWPEDMPPEIAAEVEEAARREAGKSDGPASKGSPSAKKKDVATSRGPRLRAIEGGAEAPRAPDEDAAAGDEPADEPKPREDGERRLPPYLRVIK